MPRFSPQAVKSAIKLVRQSTTVPNTSKIRALTPDTSDMVVPSCCCHSRCAKREPGIHFSHYGYGPLIPAPRCACPQWQCVSIQMKLVELAMLGLDVADSTGDRTHDDGFGLDDILSELDAGQQRTGGDA